MNQSSHKPCQVARWPRLPRSTNNPGRKASAKRVPRRSSRCVAAYAPCPADRGKSLLQAGFRAGAAAAQLACRGGWATQSLPRLCAVSAPSARSAGADDDGRALSSVVPGFRASAARIRCRTALVITSSIRFENVGEHWHYCGLGLFAARARPALGTPVALRHVGRCSRACGAKQQRLRLERCALDCSQERGTGHREATFSQVSVWQPVENGQAHRGALIS